MTARRLRLPARFASTGVGVGVAVSAGAGLLVWLTRAPVRAERLSGWDPVNFALALDRWDLALHQPHPPGYLGYVLLGRLARLVTADANAALILVGAAATAAAAIVLWKLAVAIEVAPAPRAAGTVALLSSPLVWFYSAVAEVYALEMLCALLVARGLPPRPPRRLSALAAGSRLRRVRVRQAPDGHDALAARRRRARRAAPGVARRGSRCRGRGARRPLHRGPVDAGAVPGAVPGLHRGDATCGCRRRVGRADDGGPEPAGTRRAAGCPDDRCRSRRRAARSR